MRAFHEVRNYPSDFMVWQGQYKNISFIAHWHRELELIYVRAGSAEIHVTDRALHARAGDLILCDSGDVHYCDRHSSDSCFDFVLFDTGILPGRYQYGAVKGPLLSAEQLAQAGLDGELQTLLAVLESELKNRAPHYQEIVRAQLRLFWYRLRRAFPAALSETPAPGRRQATLSGLQELLTFLEEHCGEPVTLADAARRMGFSVSHFSRLFKQLTGTGFVHYVNLLRISKAAELLMTTDSRVTDVAFACGFGNVRSFNRVFHELTGYTPSDYVKQPESRSYNFTYYRSSADVATRPEENPTVVPSNIDID